MKNRYLTSVIVEDINEKMVFIGGARQVGKTTLARKLIAPQFETQAYYNWDSRSDRRKILKTELPGSVCLLMFDEIHKYKKWKNHIKGIYDKYKDRFRILITGSACLNIYRKGGDSLQGRYHYYRLHPFSLAEIENINNHIKVFKELELKSRYYPHTLDMLDKYGGFPENIVKQNARSLRRWHNEKTERLFREDIRDVKLIRDISTMKILSDMLPERVGALLSINAIREDLEVSHRAVTSWLNILELFYYHFRVYPYHRNLARVLKKEPKLYLFDWSEISDESARFENMIASHLLKLVHFLYDYQGYKTELFFLRNINKQKVDFLICADKKPWFCLEVKINDTYPAKSLTYFKDKLRIPYAYQVVKKEGIDKIINGIRVVSASRFLSGLI